MTDLEKGVFEDDWELQVDIGKGSTSTVYKCRRKIGEKLSNIYCAVKVVSEENVHGPRLPKSKQLLQETSSRNVLRKSVATHVL